MRVEIFCIVRVTMYIWIVLWAIIVIGCAIPVVALYNKFPRGCLVWKLKMKYIKFMYRHFNIEHACYMVPDISKPSGMIYETICTICGRTGMDSM